MNYKDQYNLLGFSIISNVFSINEIEEIRKCVNEVLIHKESAKDLKFIYEKDNETIRSIMSYHDKIECLKKATTDRRILTIVNEILGDEIYVSQSKINLKAPDSLGKRWEYHRGYTFWYLLDGMLKQSMLSLFICLTEQSVDNGAVFALEGSHKDFNLDLMKQETLLGRFSNNNHTAEDLSIKIKEDFILKYTKRYSKKYIVANSGDIIIMHPSLIHASNNNTSSSSRDLMITVFNSVTNKPTINERPNYLCERDFTPLRSRNNYQE